MESYAKDAFRFRRLGEVRPGQGSGGKRNANRACLSRDRSVAMEVLPDAEGGGVTRNATRTESIRRISLTGARCADCGERESLERHHLSYDSPDAVVILCRRCHVARHVQEGRRKRQSSAYVNVLPPERTLGDGLRFWRPEPRVRPAPRAMTLSERLASLRPGRPLSYTVKDINRVLAEVSITPYGKRLNLNAIARNTGLTRHTVRRIINMEAENQKAAPREGNGRASSKEEDAEQSIPAATGSASQAEGGKI